jgi:hypothetical protein
MVLLTSVGLQNVRYNVKNNYVRTITEEALLSGEDNK